MFKRTHVTEAAVLAAVIAIGGAACDPDEATMHGEGDARMRASIVDGPCEPLASSYEAIQKRVFEGHGCTTSACHGEAKVGGLDLRAEVSYENLVDVASQNSANARVQPGTASQSFLYEKLVAATHPGSVQIAGSPMPIGAAPLSERELQAVALWITKGAPKTGAVADVTKDIDVGKLLDACLPPPTPPKIKPLEPPPPAEGVQMPLPSYLLKADSEVEHCTPFVFDVSAQVPAEYKDAARNVMFVDSSRIRQDPQSHHLVIWNLGRDPGTLNNHGGKWTCRGGASAGKTCDPRKVNADCGAGVCTGQTVPGALCGVSDNPLDFLAAMPRGTISHTQSPQEYIAPIDGVYWEVPMRGVASFNSHAFNLENVDTTLEARVNFYFANKREREMRQLGAIDKIGAAGGQAPFTRKTYCGTHVVPQNWSLVTVTGHTHRRGERFWVNDPAGKMIYENFSYSDPLYKRYDPWLTFSSPQQAQRTLEYCATYNNGLTKDDKPDLNLVTRASRMPDRTSCKPVACTAGRVTAACKTDADCDSSPGRGDGDCDACPITAGETTENEMFLLTPWYVLPAKK
ncbi:MAG: hypothetical protein ABW252_04750 [Polyangiales bacterium]